MKKEKVRSNNPKNRKAWVIDLRTGEPIGILNGEEIAARYPDDGVIKHYEFRCAGEVNGKPCNCPMYLSKREGSISYLVAKKNPGHIFSCPNGSMLLRVLRDELTDIIDMDPAGFLSSILKSKNKKFLSVQKVEEPAGGISSSGMVDGEEAAVGEMDISSAIKLFRNELSHIVAEKTFASEEDESVHEANAITATGITDDDEPILLSGSGSFETYDRRHHEEHVTVRRKPKRASELFLQFVLFAELGAFLPGSDTMHYYDVMFMPETKDLFRDRSRDFGFVAFMIAKKTWSLELQRRVEADKDVQAALNSDNKPFTVLEDPFWTSYHLDAEKKKVFHNEERLVFLLTFENEEEKEAYDHKFIGDYKKNRKTGKTEWKKSKNLKMPRLVLAEWDKTYDDFEDENGKCRRIVHAHIVSTAKQIEAFTDREVYEQIFGENS